MARRMTAANRPRRIAFSAAAGLLLALPALAGEIPIPQKRPGPAPALEEAEPGAQAAPTAAASQDGPSAGAVSAPDPECEKAMLAAGIVFAALPPEHSTPGPICPYSVSACSALIRLMEPFSIPRPARNSSSECASTSTSALPMATTSSEFVMGAFNKHRPGLQRPDYRASTPSFVSLNNLGEMA